MKQRKKRVELDFNTRLAIAKYLNDGVSIAEIARLLSRDYQVISSEIKKRSFDGEYNPLLAEEHAKMKRSYTQEDIVKRRVIDDKTKAYIEEKLALKWSPRQISSQIEKDTGQYISYPTIYRYIRKGIVKVNVERDMRRSGKKYNKSTEKRGKLDVGNRVIRYRLKKY
ncbi:helix-turn-helix domain-containing protein [Staphylococcus aureus]|uniref:helix-turn-helix domain-containing protein n=1 Tax=Staphylococcus pseudintermedius TaxID=283734 RepID=UPI0015F1FFE6|nr:helix-turn-helix domain-containing protein [Staphylococcus pseudintermedius]MDU9278986.1 helix-turn-helix domain-containing protein [Staphylococcus pseudintermedius]QDX56287.1 transposase [Staphylococcus pseudintermedius]HAR6196584.1 helix-turn-helix domain-containing protein [Staphylococcus pseudintermedius]